MKYPIPEHTGRGVLIDEEWLSGDEEADLVARLPAGRWAISRGPILPPVYPHDEEAPVRMLVKIYRT